MSENTENLFDTSVFDRVIDSGSVEQRLNLAYQLAAFLNDPDAPAAERDAVVPAVVRLATDMVVNVRRGLAASLLRTESLHSDIVFAIAADIDEIALEFLLKTPALGAWHMLAIIKVGEESKQAVIASRGDLTETVINVIVETASAAVVAKLLENPCIALDRDHCKALYVRMTDEPEVVDRLLQRQDLPVEIRLMHAKRTSNRVYHLMAQRGWMAANDAEEFVNDTEETTYVKILEQASVDELDRVIGFMCSHQLLTPSIILRAACAGDLLVVEQALAYLASVPLKRMRNLTSDRALRAVLSKSGMPDSSFRLMRSAFDVAADARANGDELSVEQFGCRMIEFVMTRYEDLLAEDKTNLLNMIAKFSRGRTRRIASRVQSDLQRAA